jgi:hypothetical protein
MRKILFAALIITLFLINAFAQSETQKSEWQRFQPVQEEFSVEFPQRVVNKSDFDEKGVLTEGFYKALFNQTYFLVHSGNEKNFVISKMLKQFAGAHRPEESAEKIGDFSGVVYSFRDDEDFYHKLLEIKAKDRSYIFHAISETKNNDAVEKFFDSIRFVDKIGEIKKSTTVEKTVATENKNTAVFPLGKGSGGGMGSGNGTGYGDGPGSGGGTTTNSRPVVPNQTSPIKILTKPRANYTDLARLCWVEGALRVRVTFLANGEIGSITPVTKLPLGLTKNAILAARKIRFEPAFNEGKPQSVTKIVEYTFTLY